MKCPVDNEVLVISDRSGIEIDYCPSCRGVWLDRGELDRMIEKAEASRPQATPSREQRNYEPRHDDRRSFDDDDYRHDSRGGYHGGTPHKKKRESFLGDLFDF